MTTFHNLSEPAAGQPDWDDILNENFRIIDRKLTIRDLESNRSDYPPKTNATFLSTDSGAVYDGTGDTWEKATRNFHEVTSDTQDLTGGSGTSFSVSDDGASVVSDPSDLNFATNITVSDDGDGTVTIDAAIGSRPSASDSGTQVLSAPTDLNFGTDLDVQDDGDGTVTIASTASSASGVPDRHFMAANGADATGGSASDTTFANLISNANAGDTIVFEEGGTYVLQNKYTINKPLTLDFTGAEIQLEGITDDPQIQFIPTDGRSNCITHTVDHTSDASEGSYTIDVSDSSPWSRGDYVMLFDKGSANIAAGDDNEHHVQFARVESIPDGTTLELSVGLHRDFDSTNASGTNEGNECARVQMLEQPEIVGGTITTGSGAGDGWAFQFNFCRNPTIRNVTVAEHLKYNFLFSECWGGIADSCENIKPQTFNSGESEFFYLRRTGGVTIRDCIVEKCRRGIDLIAGSYNISIENTEIYNFSNTGISVHQSNPAGHLNVDNCEIRAADNSTHNAIGTCIDGSVNLDYLTVNNCELQSARNGVSCTQPTTITNTLFKPAPVQSGGSAVEIFHGNVSLQGCIIDEQNAPNVYSEQPLRVDGSERAITNVTLDVNLRLDNDGQGIFVEANTSGNPIDGLRITGQIDGGGSNVRGITLYPLGDTIDNVDISVDVKNTTDHAIVLDQTNGQPMGTLRIHDGTIDCDRHPINMTGDSTLQNDVFQLHALYCSGGETNEACLDVDHACNYLFISDCIMMNPNGSDGIGGQSANQAKFSNNAPTL